MTRSFAILIFPGFPMMAFSSVIEPLRAANKLSGEELYSWSIIGGERGVIRASSGIAVTPDYSAYNAPAADHIVVCSGGDADRLQAPQPLNWIRKNLRNGANIGSVADGVFYLGRAGLLDGFSCTLHWQSQPAFAEAFPDVKLERDIYVIDRSRFTSAGGIGAFDMMLDLIGRHHGEALCRGVAEWFVHDRIRASTDRERLQLRLRTGIRDDLVLDAVAQLEVGGEGQVEISKVAARLGVTAKQRQLSREGEGAGLTPPPSGEGLGRGLSSYQMALPTTGKRSADQKGQPSRSPVYLIAAEDDALRDDTLILAAALSASGRAITLDRVPNVDHGFLHGGEGNAAPEAALARFATWLTDQ